MGNETGRRRLSRVLVSRRRRPGYAWRAVGYGARMWVVAIIIGIAIVTIWAWWWSVRRRDRSPRRRDGLRK
jgi:hypothetical protein